ncbi:hypothetical protein [Nocardia gipuzkoensis]|uniref:hypothetical protein n=1 Tax=Nocardia gipuzkoensis TaxID=2749991 RepID=UPI0015EEF983|nr:hypothetical protein [Nocardia gipuzkoensis]
MSVVECLIGSRKFKPVERTPDFTKSKGEVMANVIVDTMKCVDETGNGADEWTSDDVYLLLFRGTVPTGVNLASRTEFTVTGPGGFWDAMDDGDRRSRDVTVAAYDPTSVYVVQLIEKDNRRDVDDNVIDAYRSYLNLEWTAALARTVGQLASPRARTLATTIAGGLRGLNSIYMELGKGNDDEIGAPQRLSLPTRQSTAVLEFRGQSGRYRATFKVA